MKKLFLIIGLILVVLGIFLATQLHKSDNKEKIVTDTNGTYIALGDSIAAGIGLGDYSDASACNRTIHAYPNKIATALHYNLQSVACSGAKTQDGLLGPQEVNQLAVTPQINAVLSDKKPVLISMTIGANDADWTSFIQKCYSGTCGSESDTTAVNSGVANANKNIGNALTQIKTKYPNDTPPVIITGYYRLFPSNPSTNCSEIAGITQAELAWISQLQDTIDRSLKSVASAYNFASFVPISFAGHELCTDEPWIQTLGAKAPFHPTEAGQDAVANQILIALKQARITK